MDRNYLEKNWVRKVWSPSRKKPPNTALNNPKIIAHCEECSGYETLVLFRSLTGLRIGEALAVNCGDIDLERNFIAVDKSVATGESGRLLDSYSPTKKGESR